MKYFSRKTFACKIIACVTLLISGISLFFSHLSIAQSTQAEYSLFIEPEQCVAMRQGQRCYANVKINWQAEQGGSFCLFSSLQSKPLHCWSKVKSGNFQQEMSANANIIFSLQKKGSSIELITKELEMAWVYKKNTRKNISWRMF